MGNVSSRVAGRTSSGLVATAPAEAARAAAADAADLEALDDLDARMLKVRNLPEKVEAFVNLLPRHVLQTFGSEAFHRERTHHAAIEHRLAKDRRGQLRLRCKVAIEAAGKRIARTGRINDFGQRQRRRTE